MDMEITDVKDIIVDLDRMSVKGPQLISVDGVNGAGQKELAVTLAERFKSEQVHLDGTAGPADQKIDIAAKLKKGSVVVEGIAVRKSLTEAGLEADVSIYVFPSRRNSRRAFWEGILAKPLQEHLASLDSGADKKTVEYHWQFHPIIHADYLVEGT
jgi:hypothetical protein